MSNPAAPTGRGVNVPLAAQIPEGHGFLSKSNVSDNHHGHDTKTKTSLGHKPQDPEETPQEKAEAQILGQLGTTKKEVGHGHGKSATDTGKAREKIVQERGDSTDGIRIYPAAVSGRYSVCPPLEESNPRLDLSTGTKKPGTTAEPNKGQHSRKVDSKKGRESGGGRGGEGSWPNVYRSGWIYPAPVPGRYSVCPPELEDSMARLDLSSPRPAPQTPGASVTSRKQHGHGVDGRKKNRELEGEPRGEGAGRQPNTYGGTLLHRHGRTGRLRLVRFQAFEFSSSCSSGSESEAGNGGSGSEDGDDGDDDGGDDGLPAADQGKGPPPPPRGKYAKERELQRAEEDRAS